MTDSLPLPLTDRAQCVVKDAADAAKNLGHEFIGTEHLGLALARVSEKSVLSSALKTLGVSSAALEKEIEKILAGDPDA